MNNMEDISDDEEEVDALDSISKVDSRSWFCGRLGSQSRGDFER